jgi:hypothetical protein
VKRDLRAGSVWEDAVVQISDYVAERTAATGQRYVGALTDGVEWGLFHPGGVPRLASRLQNPPFPRTRTEVWHPTRLRRTGDRGEAADQRQRFCLPPQPLAARAARPPGPSCRSVAIRGCRPRPGLWSALR